MKDRELTPDEAYSIAVGEARHKHKTELVRRAMMNGYLRAFQKVREVPPVSEEWRDEHLDHVNLDLFESERHRDLKLRVTKHYHDNGGVRFPTIDNPNEGDETPGYLFQCFEIDCPYGSADIGSPEDGVYIEVGKTNPRRVTAAFGLVSSLIRGVWQDREVGTRRMVTIPYPADQDGREIEMFEFRPGEKLRSEKDSSSESRGGS